jgi:hypothetical protein
MPGLFKSGWSDCAIALADSLDNPLSHNRYCGNVTCKSYMIVILLPIRATAGGLEHPKTNSHKVNIHV